MKLCKFGFDQRQKLAMAGARCFPFRNEGCECAVRNVEIPLRWNDDRSLGIGLQHLQDSFVRDRLGLDEAFGCPISAVLTDDVLGSLRKGFEALSAHQQCERRSVDSEEIVVSDDAFDAVIG